MGMNAFCMGGNKLVYVNLRNKLCREERRKQSKFKHSEQNSAGSSDVNKN